MREFNDFGDLPSKEAMIMVIKEQVKNNAALSTAISSEDFTATTLWGVPPAGFGVGDLKEHKNYRDERTARNLEIHERH